MRAPKERKTKQALALLSGYSTPPNGSALDGVRVALARYGLTDQLITCALVEDIEAKPGDRLGELRLGADILGMTKHKDDPQGNKTLIVMISGQSAERYGVTVTTPTTTDGV